MDYDFDGALAPSNGLHVSRRTEAHCRGQREHCHDYVRRRRSAARAYSTRSPTFARLIDD